MTISHLIFNFNASFGGHEMDEEGKLSYRLKKIIFAAQIILCFGLSFAFADSEMTTIQKLNTDDWQKFHEEEGITLYRSQENESGLIPFRASGVFEGNIEDYLKVLLHHSEKSKWAPKLKRVALHKQISPNSFIFSEYYKTPWPATDREFLLRGEVVFAGNKHIRLIANNAKDLSFSDKDHIRCDVKLLNLDLKAVSSNKTSITFEFYGDMMGWMPVWLINIIQKKWPMRFLKGLSSQVESGKVYPTKEYLGLDRPQNGMQMDRKDDN